jgi:hypothetical protein
MLLRVGSYGSLVKYVQENLNKYGFDCGKVDGIYGDKTKSAVIAFQKAYKLAVDGIAGSKTLAKIRELENKNYKIFKLNPLKLRNEIVKMAGDKIKGDFVNGTFFGYLNGNMVSIGVLVNDGKILAKRLPHDDVKRAHFIVYKNGNVAVKMIKDIDLEEKLSNIKFAISGYNMFPLNIKAEWFNPNEVGRRTKRPMLIHNTKTKETFLVVADNATAEEGRDICKNHGDIGMFLDAGGSTCGRYNGVTFATTTRVIYGIIRW